ncbi:unnamed protein product, partial [Rotaria magnacalcarata]
MNVDSIIINGGRFVAGLPTAPFNGSIDIIMKNSGPVTIQWPQGVPIIQQKMITVLGGLDLHGTPRGISWTRLALTASSGQNMIVLRQSVNWTIGDEIIITTTDKSMNHTERHRIVNILNGNTIYTAAPLLYTHRVIMNTFANGKIIDIASAVGLLTHNVRVISQNSPSNVAGFRIYVAAYQTNMFHIYSGLYVSACYKGYVRISNTQFIGFGQFDDSYNTEQRAGIYFTGLGNYDPNRATYIDSSSFDGGNNAAISMLGTNGVP